MHITNMEPQYHQGMRTANRNTIFMLSFGQRVAYELGYSTRDGREPNDLIQKAIKLYGEPSEVDRYFDKFTIAFVEWLKQRTPRTLEHSTEELLEMFREEQFIAPNEEQVI